MHLLLYVGPASLIAAILFYIAGQPNRAEAAVYGWMIFTFVAIVVKPRTIPEYIMTVGNGLLFAIGVLAALVMYWL